ncbi:hybrid sensor histidine kinase/response regulator [uncultured Thiothrix sp.]|uniref:hybrid sensor histidine kinase/response regulator n=1 Tax=uncultured Thiothrix sp. TaxID=223185 RepID=UPI0026327848|nr:hybrid sensor histidine kinase/response regulator [uncultured Thiothrix sp.]
MTRIALLFFLLVFVGSLKAEGLPVVLDQQVETIPVLPVLEVLEDKSAYLNLKDVANNHTEFASDWHRPTKVGYSLSAWWLRFDVINQNSNNLDWYLRLQDIDKDSVQLYILPSKNTIATEAIKTIPIISELRRASFRLELPVAVQYSVYLRIHNSNRPLVFKPELLSADSLLKGVVSDHILYALVLGGMLIMSVYNLLTFFSLKERSYLSLTIFIFATFISLGHESGLLSLFIPNLNISYIHMVFYMLSVVSGNSFFYYILYIAERLPVWANLFRIHFWLSFLIMLIIYLLPFQFFFPSFFGLVLLLLVAPVVWILYKNQLPEAMTFVWAFSVILISCMPSFLFGIGVLTEDRVALNISMFGFLLFIVLLSISQSTRTRELRDQAQQSEAANKAKDALLMTMSHELRTPMHAVVSSGTLLRQTQLTVQQSDYVAKLQASAQHMLSLINNILDVSRMTHVQPEVKVQPFSLQAVLENLEKLLGDQARHKGLKFDLVSEYPTHIILMGDSMRLSQVLLNLLDNAVKFTDVGSVSLIIKPIGKWLNKIELGFNVADTGLGLSLKEQERLFEPFFQANSTINRRYKGTGLGLTISYNLVKHLGGQLSVKSRPAQGSSFFFKLSFTIAEQQAETADTQISVTTKHHYQNKMVLLVDDDPLNQFFGQELLNALGVKVKVAASGESTLVKLQADAYDLIFMDVSMPDLDGYQTTQLIRSQLGLHTLPIVALTAHAIAGERERCLAAGMNDYLAKPFSIQELEAMLARWLHDKDS